MPTPGDFNPGPSITTSTNSGYVLSTDFTPVQTAAYAAVASAGTNTVAISSYSGIVASNIPTWNGTYTAISPALSMTTQLQTVMNSTAAAGQRLFIDIPIFVSILYNYSAPIIVPSNLEMEFGPGGMIITDCLGPPLLSFMGTCSNVYIKNIQILYYQQIWTTDAITPYLSQVYTFGTLTGGSGYTPTSGTQTYNNIPLNVNTGPGAGVFANITVTNGAVTAIAVSTGGGGARYSVGQILTLLSNSYLGGTGSGFQVLVGTINPQSVSNWSTAAQNWTQIQQTALLQNTYNATGGASGVNFGPGAKSVNNTNADECALISLKGAISNITFDGGSVAVPLTSPAWNYIATAVGFAFEWNNGSSVTTSTVQNATNCTQPTDVTFKRVTFDGYIMGSVGSGTRMTYEDCRWLHYSDAQNSTANDPYSLQIGTTGNNFPPPHALYHYSSFTGSSLTYRITDCVDEGFYSGTQTRRTTISGILTSLKIATAGPSFIKGWQSNRPDGVAQIVGDATGGSFVVFEMISGSYNSATTFYQNGGGAGAGNAFIFPSTSPLLDFRGDFTITDTAAIPGAFPVNADIIGGHVNINMRFKITVQDWPLTNLSVTSISGYTLGSTYGTNYPGFCICGTNVKVYADLFFNACTSTQTFRGCIANQTATSIVNGYYEFNIHGWRSINSSQAALQQRIEMSQLKASNSCIVRDLSNSWEVQYDAGTQETTWTQTAIVTPAAGMAYTTPINFPSNAWGLTRASYLGGALIGGGNVSIGGPSATNIGSAGTPAALLANVSTFYTTATNTPYQAPLASFGAVVITPVTTNFTGIGECQISVTGKQVLSA